MIAAMSPVQIGNPISPGMMGLESVDCDLTPGEFARLFGEIDSLQLTGLTSPQSMRDLGYRADQAA